MELILKNLTPGKLAASLCGKIKPGKSEENAAQELVKEGINGCLR